MTVNKDELVKRIAADTGRPKYVTEEFIDTFFDVIVNALVSGEKVRVCSMLSFEAVESGKRMARNPRTQEPTEVPPHKRVKVKIGQNLKKLINE